MFNAAFRSEKLKKKNLFRIVLHLCPQRLLKKKSKFQFINSQGVSYF